MLCLGSILILIFLCRYVYFNLILMGFFDGSSCERQKLKYAPYEHLWNHLCITSHICTVHNIHAKLNSFILVVLQRILQFIKIKQSTHTVFTQFFSHFDLHIFKGSFGSFPNKKILSFLLASNFENFCGFRSKAGVIAHEIYP